MELLLEGYPVIVYTDKMGRWQNDLVEIKDLAGDLSPNHYRYIINYLYSEGFILDRRVKTHIVDKDNNIIKKYTGLE